MKKYIYQWLSPKYVPPRWMAFTCYSCMRNEYLWVAFPLNLLVSVAWWAQDRWARAACAPSWIEREVQARQDRRCNRGLPF